VTPVPPDSGTRVGWPESAISSLARSREDPVAFVDFYDALSRKVLQFFARRTLNGEVSLDLTAQTFAKAFEKRADFAGQTVEQAAGWLWAIARNELGAYWRERYRLLNAIDRLDPDDPRSFEEDILQAEERTVAQAARRQLKAGLLALHPAHRQAIGMRLLQDLDYEEIAERLGVSNQVARAWVSRGLRNLRELPALGERVAN
jgi:RNA polymerase sigma-70 factor (ECF subfamily)